MIRKDAPIKWPIEEFLKPLVGQALLKAYSPMSTSYQYVTEVANAQPAWDGVSAEEEELGVVRGAMRDVETSEVQTGRRPIAPFVAAIPSHLVYTGVERRIH